MIFMGQEETPMAVELETPEEWKEEKPVIGVADWVSRFVGNFKLAFGDTTISTGEGGVAISFEEQQRIEREAAAAREKTFFEKMDIPAWVFLAGGAGLLLMFLKK